MVSFVQNIFVMSNYRPFQNFLIKISKIEMQMNYPQKQDFRVIFFVRKKCLFVNKSGLCYERVNG